MAEDCLPTEAFEKAEPIVVLPSKAPWYIVKLLQLFAWSRAMSIRSFAQRNTARVARVARWWKVPAEIVSAVLLRWKDRLMKSRMTAPNSGSVHTAWLSQKLQILPRFSKPSAGTAAMLGLHDIGGFQGFLRRRKNYIDYMAGLLVLLNSSLGA